MRKEKIKLSHLGILLSIGGLSLLGNRLWYNIYSEEKKAKEKNICLKELFIKWLDNIENGVKISDYLKEMNIRTIAIYGMSDAGRKLYDELKDSGIVVEYVIDRRMIEADVDVVAIDDNFREVDMIIVTAIYEYDKICEELKRKTKNPIISLEQIIYEAESCCI